MQYFEKLAGVRVKPSNEVIYHGLETKHMTLALQAGFPSEWENRGLRAEIKRINESRNRKIIVLDDDPTGVQTVHGIDVLTIGIRAAS